MAKRNGIKIDLGAAPNINTLFGSILNDLSTEFPEFKELSLPITLSFTLRIEDGTAIIENISATPPQAEQQLPAQQGSLRDVQNNNAGMSAGREPLVEVMEHEGMATVIAEISGTRPGSIKVNAKGRKVTVSAMTDRGAFEREVELSGNVHVPAAHARFNHGVLEVTLPMCSEAHRKSNIAVV